jgi:hypothetical protein
LALSSQFSDDGGKGFRVSSLENNFKKSKNQKNQKITNQELICFE